MKQRLDLRLSQKLVMTPQLQQAIKLLQLTRFELSQAISQELLINPLLEEPSLEQDEYEEQALAGDEMGELGADSGNETAADSETEDFRTQWEEYLGDEQENTPKDIDVLLDEVFGKKK